MASPGLGQAGFKVITHYAAALSSDFNLCSKMRPLTETSLWSHSAHPGGEGQCSRLYLPLTPIWRLYPGWIPAPPVSSQCQCPEERDTVTHSPCIARPKQMDSARITDSLCDTGQAGLRKHTTSSSESSVLSVCNIRELITENTPGPGCSSVV